MPVPKENDTSSPPPKTESLDKWQTVMADLADGFRQAESEVIGGKAPPRPDTLEREVDVWERNKKGEPKGLLITAASIDALYGISGKSSQQREQQFATADRETFKHV